MKVRWNWCHATKEINVKNLIVDCGNGLFFNYEIEGVGIGDRSYRINGMLFRNFHEAAYYMRQFSNEWILRKLAGVE